MSIHAALQHLEADIRFPRSVLQNPTAAKRTKQLAPGKTLQTAATRKTQRLHVVFLRKGKFLVPGWPNTTFDKKYGG